MNQQELFDKQTQAVTLVRESAHDLKYRMNLFSLCIFILIHVRGH